MVSKQKLEVLFKTEFTVEKITDAGIREYLTKNIPDLKIKHIETYAGKSSTKAVITSNVADLLTGNTAADDADMATYVRGKSMSFLGPSSGLSAGPDLMELAAKDQEISNLGSELSKLRKELADTKASLEAASKAKVSNTQEFTDIYQAQITNMTKNIEKLDNEKSRLEKTNKTLNDRINALTEQLKIREVVRAQKGGKGTPHASNPDDQIEAMEKLMVEKKREFEEERMNMQENIAQMGLRILAEKDRADKFEEKAKQNDTLQELLGRLQKEKEELAAQKQTLSAEIATLRGQLKTQQGQLQTAAETETTARRQRTELEQQLSDLKAQAAELAKAKKSLETRTATLVADVEAKAGVVTELGKQNASLTAERNQLAGELKQLKNAQEQHAADKETFKTERDGLKTSIKEKEQVIRDLKLELAQKNDTLKEHEAETKLRQTQAAALEEAEQRIEVLTKELQEARKVGKNSEKDQQAIKQRLEALEADNFKKEKEVKDLTTQLEKVNKELITAKARLGAAETRSPPMPRLNLPTSPSHRTEEARSTAPLVDNEEFSRLKKDWAEASSEASKLRRELETTKMELAALNGKYLEKTQTCSQALERLELLEKENAANKESLKEYEGLSKSLEEYKGSVQEVARLKAECSRLQVMAEEGADAREQVTSLREQNELLLKDNNELKGTLYEMESSLMHHSSSLTEDSKNDTSSSKETKLKVIEELRESIAEVIYVYKTLETNTKDLMLIYTSKKEKIEHLAKIAASIESARKKEDKLAQLQNLAGTFGFIPALGVKADNLKFLIPALAQSIAFKQARIPSYNDQLLKFEKMVNVAQAKKAEYEVKLSHYY